MKIIIDIDSYAYDCIKNNSENHIPINTIQVKSIIEQIRQANPLPKNTGRLIDAEVFIQELCKFEKVNTATVARALVETPTIIGGDK